MATQQDEGGVPVSMAHELQQFRLLELPQEIVDLIDAPTPPRLFIKSLPPTPASIAPDTKPAYAVLCTPSKAFQLRQVQTSNSLHVTQPALEDSGHGLPIPTMRAIATCTATLELYPVDDSPIPLLEELLPVYDIVDGEVDAAGNGKGKAGLFLHIPLSDGQCESGWRELMAFEFAGSSYRPSANTLVQVWKSILAAALAEGMKLDAQFLSGDLARIVAEEGHPETLALAIIQRLDNEDESMENSWSSLDRTKTVQFVGKALLEARQGQPHYPTAEFLEAWKDSLPENWRQDAVLSSISGLYETPSSDTISARGGAAAENEGKPAIKSNSSRKWHEKFGRARRR